MMIELEARSQITLPDEIVKSLGVREGDRFDVMERDGGVFLCPVVVYPKAKLEQIAKIIKDHEMNPTAAFESVEDIFRGIGIDLGDADV
jgi:AbrB family looped-hinge helix DNA binding protein